MSVFAKIDFGATETTLIAFKLGTVEKIQMGELFLARRTIVIRLWVFWSAFSILIRIFSNL